MLRRLTACYKWYVSEKLLNNDRDMRFVHEWLSDESVAVRPPARHGRDEQHYYLWLECEIMLRNRYWRNTKVACEKAPIQAHIANKHTLTQHARNHSCSPHSNTNT